MVFCLPVPCLILLLEEFIWLGHRSLPWLALNWPLLYIGMGKNRDSWGITIFPLMRDLTGMSQLWGWVRMLALVFCKSWLTISTCRLCLWGRSRRVYTLPSYSGYCVKTPFFPPRSPLVSIHTSLSGNVCSQCGIFTPSVAQRFAPVLVTMLVTGAIVSASDVFLMTEE